MHILLVGFYPLVRGKPRMISYLLKKEGVCG
jgi:hypothetical protein